MTGSKIARTSHLKRHIAMGICTVGHHNQENEVKESVDPQSPSPTSDISENVVKLPRKHRQVANGTTNTYFNDYRCGPELAIMIIKHDYPLHIVEHSGFVDFARTLQPQFGFTTVASVREQIMGVYLHEKQKILNLLNGTSGRLNLSIDLWNSNRSSAHAVLTGHFVDQNWKLHRRVLNVVTLQFPESDTAVCQAVACCLNDWYFEDGLFTCTFDRSFVKEKARENIRNLLSIKNSFVLNGQLLINSCYARLLRNLSLDAIHSMKEIVEQVRYCVKYIKTSDDREKRFTKLKQQLQVPTTMNLAIDDLTKWNTTYEMLMAASELKEVFSCLDTSDPDYKSTMSMQDWGQVDALCVVLNLFYEAANILTSPTYPTTNLFFLEAWKIHHKLMRMGMSPDVSISSLTKPLLETFSKYWEDSNMVLTVAVVMDPRFKMKFVELSFSRIYGEDAETWIKIVEDGLRELYLEYVVQPLPPPTFIEGNDPLLKTEDGILSNGDVFSDVDVYISDIMGGQHMESELYQYLDEPLLPRFQDFDILGWWKTNQLKYPTLSKLASDVLSIPVAAVAPDAIFDTSDRRMDGYKSSLNNATVQALVCTKDWLSA